MGPVSRAEQRRRTEERILVAARTLFAEHGYDRTTIRAIAAEADTDPGLVMRYFGSKERLFARVAVVDRPEPLGGSPEQVAETLLAALDAKLAAEPVGALAALRSMFTHPEAAREVREAMLAEQRQAEAATPGEDAALRTALIGALTLGTVIGRYMLDLDGLRDASPEQITALLRQPFHAIVHGPPNPDPHGAQGETDARPTPERG
ncbi:TetR/AcrR family transcriptional regulator [Actinomadura graeca]|uniref:TetR/AcrR family transcriptional regulator n=1 Tax=Actinomadura graeca TaxID=2750812 RepID=A0ABX8QYL5_9ACTN|nr:TetR/AcrR family transcriptional regulator [Actinomadura graeca]QXJ23924.1 TetR/AcrR family transcriptional regulator [Actinomadura graeca]